MSSGWRPAWRWPTRGNGFAGKQRREIVAAAVARYRQAMRSFAGMTNLAVWYAHMDMDQMRAQFDAQLRPQAAQGGG